MHGDPRQNGLLDLVEELVHACADLCAVGDGDGRSAPEARRAFEEVPVGRGADAHGKESRAPELPLDLGEERVLARYGAIGDEDGLPYSRESGYFANEEAASSALRQFPCELEQLGQGRYVADLAASNLMVSITIIPSRESFARLEITQYQLVQKLLLILKE